MKCFEFLTQIVNIFIFFTNKNYVKRQVDNRGLAPLHMWADGVPKSLQRDDESAAEMACTMRALLDCGIIFYSSINNSKLYLDSESQCKSSKQF